MIFAVLELVHHGLRKLTDFWFLLLDPVTIIIMFLPLQWFLFSTTNWLLAY